LSVPAAEAPARRGTTRSRLLRLALLVPFAVLHGQPASGELRLVWATPNTAWAEGQPPTTFVQPTVSGTVESALFGCTRSSGTQFHEGLDLKPLQRDRQGESTDPIFAVMDGVVRYVNLRAGAGGYGRYVVLEHPEVVPAVYSLYAHLRSVEPGVVAGLRVTAGQRLATMGRSAGGYTIPKERAHLHLEIGLRISDRFDAWYRGQGFGSPNAHGNWNGLNLAGVDPLAFYETLRSRRANSPQGFFEAMETAVRLRIATPAVPDFVRRYPALVQGESAALSFGWEIDVNATGLPFRWRPLDRSEVAGLRMNEVRIVEVSDVARRRAPCRELVVRRGGRPVPGADLAALLGQLFGIR
jgi:peptidoglycan LD-endopeptidase LytH